MCYDNKIFSYFSAIGKMWELNFVHSWSLGYGEQTVRRLLALTLKSLDKYFRINYITLFRKLNNNPVQYY